MPAIAPNSLVLITGVSGLVGSATAEEMLDAGYHVRGAVRSQEKGEALTKHFENKPGKFDFVIVKDLEEHAFDQAVQGVDAVIHMATPVQFDEEDPKAWIDPAVSGATGILKSLQKHNPALKRIVLTSSVVAHDTSSLKSQHVSENDWNNEALETVDRSSQPFVKYAASKVASEQAFWKFFEQNKVNFDGVACNPGAVLGPVSAYIKSPSQLSAMGMFFYPWLTGQKTEADLGSSTTVVDLRDVAKAHMRALEVEEASQRRFLLVAGVAVGNDWALTLNEKFPQIKGVPNGDPSRPAKYAGDHTYDGTLATKVLGLKYHTLEETTIDMTASLIERFEI